MAPLSISRTVGKGRPGASEADITLIQCCLQAIKVKTKFGLRSLYPGKVDGKVGQKMIDAICAFHRMIGEPEKGYIEPHGSCFKQLVKHVPSGVKASIASTSIGVDHGTGRSGANQKTVRMSEGAARDAATKSPLPPKEAEGLAALIRAAAQKNVALVHSGTGVTRDGRFSTQFKVNSAAAPIRLPVGKLNELAAISLKALASQSTTWSMPIPTKLELISRTAYEGLR